MKVTVLGSGPGALAIAYDMSVTGRHDITLADLPEFRSRIDEVRERGGIQVAAGNGGGTALVGTADDIEDAASEAEIILLSVRAPGHEEFAQRIGASLTHGTPIIFLGEGGGALVMRRELASRGEHPTSVVAETNALPFIARTVGPGVITIDRKRGGVLLASIPSTRVQEISAFLLAIWPFLEVTDSVWTTALLNFDAIDTVPVAIANAAALESRPGFYLLWGEGATPSSVRLIEAVDRELRAIRTHLGSQDGRRFQDFLVAQGLAPAKRTLYETMRAGGVMRSVRPAGGPEALSHLLDLDVPWTLVLASSIAHAIDLPTPTIDAIIQVASIMLSRDLGGEGRTLATLGLDGFDAAALRRYATTGVP